MADEGDEVLVLEEIPTQGVGRHPVCRPLLVSVLSFPS